MKWVTEEEFNKLKDRVDKLEGGKKKTAPAWEPPKPKSKSKKR